MNALSREAIEQAMRVRGNYWRRHHGRFGDEGNEFWRTSSPNDYQYTAEDVVRASQVYSRAGSAGLDPVLTAALKSMLEHDNGQNPTRRRAEAMLHTYLLYLDYYFFFGGLMRAQYAKVTPDSWDLAADDPLLQLQICHENSRRSTARSMWGYFSPSKRRITMFTKMESERDEDGKALEMLPVGSFVATLAHELTHAYLWVMSYENPSRAAWRFMMVDEDDGWGIGHGEMFLQHWLFMLNTLEDMLPKDKMLGFHIRHTEARLAAARRRNREPLRYYEVVLWQRLVRPVQKFFFRFLDLFKNRLTKAIPWLSATVKYPIEGVKGKLTQQLGGSSSSTGSIVREVLLLSGTLYLLWRCVQPHW